MILLITVIKNLEEDFYLRPWFKGTVNYGRESLWQKWLARTGTFLLTSGQIRTQDWTGSR